MKNCFLTKRASGHPRRAFTLVELLVVISIVALLAAVMLPVLGRVREGGRRTTCASNLRQLGLAFQQYMQDNRRYPMPGEYQKWADGGHWVTGGLVSTGLPKNFTDAEKGLADPSSFVYVTDHVAYPDKGAIFPYVKSTVVYTCPSAPDVDKKKLSYSMNCALAGLGEARLRKPAEIVLLVDEGETVNDGYFWAFNSASSTDSLMTRHNGGGNILFADGHVKFFPFDSLPLNNQAAGIALKTATTGPVRFLDLAFGPKGASVIPALQNNPAVKPTTDSCGASLS